MVNLLRCRSTVQINQGRECGNYEEQSEGVVDMASKSTKKVARPTTQLGNASTQSKARKVPGAKAVRGKTGAPSN